MSNWQRNQPPCSTIPTVHLPILSSTSWPELNQTELHVEGRSKAMSSSDSQNPPGQPGTPPTPWDCLWEKEGTVPRPTDYWDRLPSLFSPIRCNDKQVPDVTCISAAWPEGSWFDDLTSSDQGHKVLGWDRAAICCWVRRGMWILFSADTEFVRLCLTLGLFTHLGHWATQSSPHYFRKP